MPEFTDPPAVGDIRGGNQTIHTDQNGQATIVFPVPFDTAPQAIVLTPVNNVVVVGVLVLTTTEVTVFVWDVVGNKLMVDFDVDLYWIGIF